GMAATIDISTELALAARSAAALPIAPARPERVVAMKAPSPAAPPPAASVAESASKLRERLLICSAPASTPESMPPERSPASEPPQSGLATRIDRQIDAAEVAAPRPARSARLAGVE